MATLTYVYADSTAVLGPLATYAEPHCYDLCDIHAERLTVPRGWNVLRLQMPGRARVAADDLYALADAVRESVPAPAPEPAQSRSNAERLEAPAGADMTRRHLRVLREEH
ncbi:hypothetical protein GCM10023166_25120 [Paeniglutamicibacter cryotolerans]|uniref:DUF3499 domain-containing protein n=1 Tax=Paeniglutamicibacter cryotolerans TaxID=670079 RepID=A0A839QRR6_9MICC|nr:hypothetical protein [Paeniglutamicibacter cryotolerans]